MDTTLWFFSVRRIRCSLGADAVFRRGFRAVPELQGALLGVPGVDVERPEAADATADVPDQLPGHVWEVPYWRTESRTYASVAAASSGSRSSSLVAWAVVSAGSSIFSASPSSTTSRDSQCSTSLACAMIFPVIFEHPPVLRFEVYADLVLASASGTPDVIMGVDVRRKVGINYPSLLRSIGGPRSLRVGFVGGLPFCRYRVGGVEIAVQGQRPRR